MARLTDLPMATRAVFCKTLSLASNILNERGFNPDAIERQLAHIPTDKIRAAYNRAEYLAERTEFMQWYSESGFQAA